MASSPAHPQALIDALSDTLHMEIRVTKITAMIVSAAASAAIAFTFDARVVEKVSAFEYLGMHFGASGTISHLINPAALWTGVQQ